VGKAQRAPLETGPAVSQAGVWSAGEKQEESHMKNGKKNTARICLFVAGQPDHEGIVYDEKALRFLVDSNRKTMEWVEEEKAVYTTLTLDDDEDIEDLPWKKKGAQRHIAWNTNLRKWVVDYTKTLVFLTFLLEGESIPTYRLAKYLTQAATFSNSDLVTFPDEKYKSISELAHTIIQKYLLIIEEERS
jgi:hypothetical protein